MELRIQHLKNILSQPLPGTAAQDIMAPTARFTGKVLPNKTHARKSSVFILLYQKEGRWTIPFIKRQVYEGVHSGQISFPGGKQELYDENLLATAYRETQEEIGVEANEIEHVGSLSSIYIPNSNFYVYPQVGLLKSPPCFKPDCREVEMILEVAIDDLMNPSCINEFSKIVNDINLRAPYFEISSYQIWGATAMMLSEFLEIIRINLTQLNWLTPSYNDYNAPKCQ